MNVDGEGKHRLAEEYSDYDSDDYKIYEAQQAKKRNASKNISKDPNIGVLMPEDITENISVILSTSKLRQKEQCGISNGPENNSLYA